MKHTQQIRFFRDMAISGVEIAKVQSSRHVFPRHAHDNIYALSLIIKGTTFCLDRKNTDLTVSRGQIVLLNPGQVHTGIPVGSQSISYWMLYVDIQTMSAFAGDIYQQQGMLPEFNRMVIENPRLASRFSALAHAFEHNQDLFEKEKRLCDFFSDLFLFTCDRQPRDSRLPCDNRTINMAMDVLSENLDVGITLDTVARKVGFSRYHFIRQFKRYTGVSPHQFRIQQRVEAAKTLIRQGLPFSEIALETGFSDQSHFTNTFRHYTGATPSQYARR